MGWGRREALRPPFSCWLLAPRTRCPRASQAPLGSEVFERGRPVSPRQVLVELLPQRLQAAPVRCAQAELGDVEAGGVGHVDHEGVGQDQQLVLLGAQRQASPSALVPTPRCPPVPRPLTHLRIQLHDVGHLVPAEAHEALVVLGAVSPHYNVRLEVWLPRHAVRHGGCPPLGVVRRGMAFWPHVVPVRRDGSETPGKVAAP